MVLDWLLGQRIDKVKCNGCGRRFMPEVYETKQDSGGVRLSFDCPHCAREYVVADMTPEMVEIKQQIQAMRKAALADRKEAERLRKVQLISRHDTPAWREANRDMRMVHERMIKRNDQMIALQDRLRRLSGSGQSR